MAFIRFRKLKMDTSGNVLSGSAAIIDVHYISGAEKYHSKQVLREKLGKVIEIYDKRKGLFQSPTRGLIQYDADKDEFSQQLSKDDIQNCTNSPIVVEKLFPDPNVHTVFGDVFLLIEILKQSKLLQLIHKTFKEHIFFERLLCHILHGILKDGSRISCEDFIAKSFASYCVEHIPLQSLKSDTEFFSVMSEDGIKIQFFKEYVEFMRKENPDFGKGCFVDSTPLPNSINSPFNALCSHGLSATSIQMRLILVLDDKTYSPIWYEIITGNVLDINTLKTIRKDVEISLDVTINGYVLDAGYVSKELIQGFAIQKEDESLPEKRYLARMPAKKGFPYHKLYLKTKEYFSKAKYDFIRNDHSYFGKSMIVNFFNTDVMCYVYIDYANALRGYSEYIKNNEEEFEKMTNNQKDWYKVKFFFILVSNYIKTPKEILEDYFLRTNIETVFKTDNEYLKLLPLRKWSDATVKGKIFSDIIDSIIRQKMYSYIKNTYRSISSVIGICQSLMCIRDSKSNKVYVETPRKQVKECYNTFKIKIPSEINMSEYMYELYNKVQ